MSLITILFNTHKFINESMDFSVIKMNLNKNHRLGQVVIISSPVGSLV